MKKEQVHYILYDLALTMSGENRYEPLLEKTLQKILFHTGFPTGAFLTPVHQNLNDLQNNYLIEAAIGDKSFTQAINQHIKVKLPDKPHVVQLLENVLPDSELGANYSTALWLPLPDQEIMLLLGNHFPQTEVAMEHVFAPILANLNKMIRLCKTNEAYTHQLEIEKNFALNDLARFRKAIDVTTDLILLFDEATLQCIDCNQTALNKLNYSEKSIKQKNLSDLLQIEKKIVIDYQFSAFIQNKNQFEFEGLFRRKNNSSFPIEINFSILKDAQYRSCIIAVARDITERRVIESELNRHRHHLEELVDIRTKELANARDEAVRATQIKSEFLANMSHELRTPLNSIIGFTSIVKDGLAGEINDEQKKQLELVYNSGQHLLGLINNILDLAKVEAGKVEVYYSEVDLDYLILNAMETVQPLAAEKGLDIEIDNLAKDAESLVIITDPNKLAQIILNLLSNAIKFTDSGGIKIQYELTAQQTARISVIDTGVGISPGNQAKVFDSFQQIDSSVQRKHQGTGLGLSICKHYIDLMKGNIELTSTPGQGSTFTVILPGPQSQNTSARLRKSERKERKSATSQSSV